MKKRILLMFMVVFLATTHSGAGTDEIAELKELVLKQSQQLRQLQERIEQLEANQRKQEQKTEEQITKAMEEKQVEALPEAAKWIEKVKWSGDFRYRHETIEAEGDGKPDRHRNRIRARLRLDAKVNDEWDLGFQLATADSQGSTSTNQTLKDEFNVKNLWVDQAYADFHPDKMPGLNVLMGKFATPLYRVGKNQLIWDSDLNPEGIAANYTIPLSSGAELFINGGGFWVNEVDLEGSGPASGADASLWALQTGLKHKKEDSHLLYGATYLDFGNVESATITSTSKGTSSTFDNNFRIIEVFAEAGTIVNTIPVSIFGNYVTNVGTDSSKDAGWLLGLKFNRARKVGSWECGYSYREIEADAVPSLFNDSDFIDGGTAGKGHVFEFKYQLAKNIQTALTYFLNERDRSGGNDLNFRRLQADLVFKF